MQELFLEFNLSLPLIIGILILTGFSVGFINTLAGGGTVISYMVFMALGLPIGVANGSIRPGGFLQTFVSSLIFNKNNCLDLKKGLELGIPIVLGSILGANIAVQINESVFQIIVSVVMIMMMILLLTNPKRWIEGKKNQAKELSLFWQIPIYFLIGTYGGFVHIGVGIFLLAAFVLISGYDLLKANALKIFVVCLYSPFALIVFMYNHQIHYGIALITSIGNVLGGIVATKVAVRKGSQFIYVFLIIIVAIFISKSLNLFPF